MLEANIQKNLTSNIPQDKPITVSVIIPSYNTAKYITKAIKSALDQTLQEIEVIVVDDASQDNSVEIIRQIKDVRLKLLINQKNLGVGGARNRALKAAQGKWVAVLDADDWYSPQRLERLVKVATEKNADVVADDLYLIDDGATSPWGTLIGEKPESINSIQKISAADFVNSDIPGKKGLFLGYTKPLFRRNFLVNHKIKYDETLKVTQDFWIDMDCFAQGANFYIVPEPYYYYRSRKNSGIYCDTIQRLEDECRAIANFFLYQEYLRKNPDTLAAVQEKQQQTDKWLQYYRFVNNLKKGNLWSCLAAINFNWEFWQFTMSRIFESLQRRLGSMFVQQEQDYLKLTLNNR